MQTIYDFVKQQRDNYRSYTVTNFPHTRPSVPSSFIKTASSPPAPRTATDLDTKNVKVFSDNSGEVEQPFLLTLKNRN